LYDSLVDSLEDEPFEVIFAGPYNPPDSLNGVKNVKFIRDWGHQIRCQQLALNFAEGEYVHWCSDDGVALPGALKQGLEEMEEDSKPVALMLKYLEGDNPHPYMKEDGYYLLHSNPGTRTAFIPEDWYGLNTAIADTHWVRMLGGWDCRYASCIAHADFAVRLQQQGLSLSVSNIIAHHVSHTPGIEGDHGPMHYAQTLEDEPLFQEVYGRPIDHTIIPVDNWRIADAVWKRRFN
jgi:hypothetical protein